MLIGRLNIKDKKKMTKAEAFEWLKGKKVRCYNIVDANLSNKIFKKLQECGCYWPPLSFDNIGDLQDTAWAFFINDDGVISHLPISCAHLYKELGGVDIPFDDILSIEIIENKHVK